MNKQFIYIFNIIFLIFHFAFPDQINASRTTLSEADEKSYDQGVLHRKNKEITDAIKCFQPLAERNHIKAQHNFAMCLYDEGNDFEAYNWFKRAADQGPDFKSYY